MQRASVHAMHQDALRPQGAVVEPLGMRVLQRLGNVAHHLQALSNGERLAFFAQQVVQAHGLGVVVEDQRRAEFGFFQVVDAQDARVINAFEHFELATRLAQAGRAGLWR